MQKIKRTIFLFLFGVLYCLQIQAQQYSIDLSEVSVNEKTLNATSAIIQDKKGYIWFGTIDGLVRYDGKNFKNYTLKKNYPNSISNNIVRALEIDSSNVLWIGTQGGGLNSFDIDKGKFTTYVHQDSDKNTLIYNDIWSLRFDRNGNLWIGTWGGGVDCFNPKTKEFTHYKQSGNSTELKPENEIRTIYESDDGYIWLGTHSGMLKLDKEKGIVKKFKHQDGNNNSLANNSVYDIIKKDNNSIWIGTLDGGLQQFNLITEEFITFSKNNRINKRIYALDQRKNGDLVVATNQGLFLISHSDTTITDITLDKYEGLVNENLRTVFVDKSGYIWIGNERGVSQLTINVGFSFLKHEQANKKSISGKIIRSVYEDNNNNLWIGTLGNGLNKFELATGINTRVPYNKSQQNALDNEITSLLEDSNNNFWIGTWAKGVFLFDKDKLKVLKNFNQFSGDNTISDNRVQAVIEEKPGLLWIATENGLNRFDYKKNKWLNFYYNYDDKNSVSGNKFQSKALLVDKNGIIWAGTWANGLNAIIPQKDDEFKFLNWKNNYNDTSSVASNSVISLYLDSSGNLWIGTFGSGICFVSAKEVNNIKKNENLVFRNFTTNDGLVNNVVYGIVEDDYGNIWFSTENGISMLNPESMKFTNFHRNNGLTSEQFFWGGTTKGKNKLFFGSVDGLNIIYPEKIHKPKTPSRVEIININFYDESAKEKYKKLLVEKNFQSLKTLKLNKEQAFLTLQYSCLNYDKANKVEYAYKLENYSKEWHYVGTKDEFTISNLSPGKYYFYLKLKSNNNDWCSPHKLLEIEIIPFWWETFWFKSLIVLLILGTVAFILYLKFGLLTKQKMILEKEYKKSTQELYKKNKQLEISNEKMAKQKAEAEHQKSKTERINEELNDFAYIISHDLKAPLRGINQLATWLSMDYADKFDEDAKQQFALLIERVKTMDSMIEGVLQYSRATNFQGELTKVNLNKLLNEIIDLIQAPENIEIKILNELPTITGEKVRLMQVFQNLIGNAVKYNNKEKGLIEISCSENETHYQFTIADNGPGIEAKYHDEVFKIFKTGGSIKKDSSGIGLSIVKRIVQIYKGQIKLESEAQKGAKFIFSLSKEL